MLFDDKKTEDITKDWVCPDDDIDCALILEDTEQHKPLKINELRKASKLCRQV